MAEETAFFTRDGDAIVPTGVGASVWDRTKQGGAPIAGLIGQVLDGVAPPTDMVPARLTIDIYAPVPMEAMQVETRLLRDGKRIQIVEAVIAVGGRVFARASLLRTRTLGPAEAGTPPSRAFPEHVEPVRRIVSEMIRVEGDERTPGPGALWMRLIRPIIAGEAVSPLARTALAADWGTTVAPPASFADWTYANLDISLHFTRPPVGEWLLLDGWSEAVGNGTAMAHMRMGDRTGMFAFAHQAVFLDRRAEGSAV